MAKFHVGQSVWYHYRSAIGRGKIVKVVNPDSADPHYKIAQTDHHPGEPKIVTHRESALHAGSGGGTKVGKKRTVKKRGIRKAAHKRTARKRG